MNSFLENTKNEDFKQHLVSLVPDKKEDINEIYKQETDCYKIGFRLIQLLHPDFRLNLILRGPYDSQWESEFFHGNQGNSMSCSNLVGHTKQCQQLLKWFQGNDVFSVNFDNKKLMNAIKNINKKNGDSFPVIVFEAEKALLNIGMRQYIRSSVRIACCYHKMRSPEMTNEEEKLINELFARVSKSHFFRQIPVRFVLYKLLEY